MKIQCRLRIIPSARARISSTLAQTPLKKVRINENNEKLGYIVGRKEYCVFEATYSILPALTRRDVQKVEDARSAKSGADFKILTKKLREAFPE